MAAVLGSVSVKTSDNGSDLVHNSFQFLRIRLPLSANPHQTQNTAVGWGHVDQNILLLFNTDFHTHPRGCSQPLLLGHQDLYYARIALMWYFYPYFSRLRPLYLFRILAQFHYLEFYL